MRHLTLATITLLLAGALCAQSAWVKAVDGCLSRTGQATVTFNGALWSFGGRAANTGAPSTPNGPLTSEIWSSPDGCNWTLQSLSAPWTAREGHAAVAFNGRIWLVGGQADVWSSGDGLNWRMECGNAGWGQRQYHTSFAFNGRIWLAGGSQAAVAALNDVWSSADGANWQLENAAAPWSPRRAHAGLEHNGRLWVLGGSDATGMPLNDVWSSSDGINWTPAGAAAAWPARENFGALSLGGRMYVLGGTVLVGASAAGFSTTAAADVWSSQDGVNWTAETFLADWSARCQPVCRAVGNELWVMGGANEQGLGFSDAWSSPDGSVWTRQAPYTGVAPGRIYEGRCAHNGKLWIIGGATTGTSAFADVWSSADGVNWTLMTDSAPFGNRSGLTVEVLNGRMYVMGGEYQLQLKSDVWSSDDGINWAQVATGCWPAAQGYSTTAGRTHHQSVVFDAKLWVIGGIDATFSHGGQVWSSPDGAAWTLVGTTFPGDYLRVEPFNGELWAFGGTSTMADPGRREVWSSPDGASWTRHTSTAPWGTRSKHGSAVTNGRMYLIGGAVATTHGGWQTGLKNDLWSSTDGLNWVLENPLTAYTPKRRNHHTLKLGNTIWMCGGWDGNGSPNFYRSQDSWCLLDGVSAPQFTSAPAQTAVTGQAYSYAPAFTGSPTPKLSVSGMLPSWLEVDAATGELHGTPDISDIGTAGPISLTVSNAFGTDARTFQITVMGPPPQITSTPVTLAVAGQPYSYTVSATGGPPAPALQAAGLPAWLSFHAPTGVLAGTPGVTDTGLSMQITITATNGTPPDACQVFSIDVIGSAPQLSLPAAHVVALAGTAFVYRLSVTGTPAPSLTVSTLPAWLSFDAPTGEFSGTPLPGMVGQSAMISVTCDNGWGSSSGTFEIRVVDGSKGRATGAAGCAGNPGAGWLLLLPALLALRLRTRSSGLAAR